MICPRTKHRKYCLLVGLHSISENNDHISHKYLSDIYATSDISDISSTPDLETKLCRQSEIL